MQRLIGPLVIAVLALSATGADSPRGYQKKVTVAGPTRLDWTFAFANQSVAEPPADWLGDYDSRKQSYELFVPPNYTTKQTWPLIVFISAGADPAGWRQLEPVCKQLGILFAAPYGVGNDTPGKKRVRIVLDVLDDIRRQYRIDADRTYISGFSGGGRIACAIAFALPEYFGGVFPVCASGDLREESWLRQRVVDRLSVALITGETDFNRGELERLRGPYLKEVGVRQRVWVVPKLGHGIPASPPLLEAVRWLEEGLASRQKFAKNYPASRLAVDAALSREEWATALLEEGKKRLQAKDTLYTGLMQLQGVMNRWNGLAPAAEAKKLLLEYEARNERPWEADDIREQRRYLVARARALDAYASGTLPAQYMGMRADMLRQALEMWELIVKDGQDEKAAAEGKKRIPALQKLLDAK